VFAARNQLSCLAPQGELDAVEAKHLFDAQLLKYGSDASQFKAQFDKVGSDMHTHTHTRVADTQSIYTHTQLKAQKTSHTHIHTYTRTPLHPALALCVKVKNAIANSCITRC